MMTARQVEVAAIRKEVLADLDIARVHLLSIWADVRETRALEATERQMLIDRVFDEMRHPDNAIELRLRGNKFWGIK